MRSRVIVVLAMHRSGSSAITRGLQVLGVELGDNLISAREDHEKGYWEDLDLNALNIELLATLNSDWHYLAPIAPRDVNILRNKGYVQRAVDLLQGKTSNVSVFGFKDPRTAKLLPFWEEVFRHCPFDINYLIVVRHPLSVVKSLAKRNDFEAAKSYASWLEHVINCLTNTVGYSRVFVDYDSLIQRPDHELGRIATSLELKVDSTELRYYKTEFLDQRLRHSVHSLGDLSSDTACPHLVREIYATLLDVASDRRQISDVALQHQATLWANGHERLKSALMLADKQYMEIGERDGRIANLNSRIEQLNQTIEQFQKSRSWRVTAPLRGVSRFLCKWRKD